jgi:predicted esterase
VADEARPLRIGRALAATVFSASLLLGGVARADERRPTEPRPHGQSRHGQRADNAPHLRVPVPGDRPTEVLFGPEQNDTVLVYMHGVCGDPYAFKSWGAAAQRFGTFISLRGGLECKGRARRTKWSYRFRHIDQRIRAAIAAVSDARMRRNPYAEPLRHDRVVLVGYSQGAARAEALAATFPERYRRVALISGPREADPKRLERLERVLLMAGSHDAARPLVKRAAPKLEQAGITVELRLLPKARHGEYGPEALRVMGEALGWLLQSPAAPRRATPPAGKAPRHATR